MSGHKKYLSVALLSAVLLPAMASAADAPATFTPEQEAKIGKIAADYLVAHPEVLLQASQKLQQIQAEAAGQRGHSGGAEERRRVDPG